MTDNKKYILLFYILSFLLLSNNAQTPFYTFLNGWRGAAVSEANGYIYTISNYEEQNNGTRSWLKKHKITLAGNVIEEKNIRVDSSDLEGVNVLGYGAVSFNNNNNWLLSNFNTNPNGNFYNNIYRFTQDFDTVNKSLLLPFSGITGTTQGFVKNIKYINDSTIILAGTERYSYNQYSYTIKVMSVDTLGNINWQTDIYSQQTTIGNFMNSVQIATAADGGYFITCVDSPDLPDINNDNKYFLLVKLDANGNLQWKKRITDGIHTTNPGSVIQKDSNSYLVTWAESWLIGTPYNTIIGTRKGLDSSSVWMGEIDLQGNFKWKKSLYKTAINCDTIKNSDSFFPYNTIKLNDGNYLICVDHFMNNATYIKITPEGEVIWNRKIVLLQEQIQGGLLSFTNIKYTKEASDGGILGIGEYFSNPSQLFPNGIRTSVLIKLDQYGCLEPGCHLEGCTDTEALNYNPEAVYDCGCVYDPCSEGFKVTIDVRQNAIMSNTDFYLKPANSSDTLIQHKGYYPSFYDNFKQSVCIPDDCEQEYELYINIRGYSPPNAILPFQDSDPYSLGYYAYFNVLINDSIVMDIGRELFVDRDTTIRFKFCTPEPTITTNLVYSLYPNPATNNITLQLPDDIDLNNPTYLQLFDLSGRLVLNYPIYTLLSSNSVQQLANGIYTAVVLQGEQRLFTQKVVKI